MGSLIEPSGGAAGPVRGAGAGEVDEEGPDSTRVLHSGDAHQKAATARAGGYIETDHG